MSLVKKAAAASVALTALVGLSTNASAGPEAETGYLGLGLGMGSYINAFVDTNDGGPKTKNTFGGRLYAGYNFTSMVAVELGWTQFAKATQKFDDENKLSQTAYALDLVGVANLPVTDQATIYVKGGVAHVWDRLKSNGDGAEAVFGSGTNRAFRPKVGIGAKYDLTSNLAAGVSYDYIAAGLGKAKDNKGPTPDLGLVSANLEYSF